MIREPVVEDGTPCDNPDSSNAVCVQGTCTVRSHAPHHIDSELHCMLFNLQPVGCDDVLESEAQPDSCGVCNGDDSGATVVTDTLTGFGGFGYHEAGVIPAGARNVRIAEATATSLVYIGKVINMAI